MKGCSLIHLSQFSFIDRLSESSCKTNIFNFVENFQSVERDRMASGDDWKYGCHDATKTINNTGTTIKVAQLNNKWIIQARKGDVGATAVAMSSNAFNARYRVEPRKIGMVIIYPFKLIYII